MQNNKGYTMIELICVIIIISILTALIVPRMIDLEGSAERKLLDAVLSELNAREHMAWLGCKLGPDCNEAELDDLVGISFDKKYKNLTFDGGNTYPVYRADATEFNGPMWYSGKKPKPPKPPKKPKK